MGPGFKALQVSIAKANTKVEASSKAEAIPPLQGDRFPAWAHPHHARAIDHLEPAQGCFGHGVGQAFCGLGLGAPEPNRPLNGQGPRPHQGCPARANREGLLGIGRWPSCGTRFDPNLQQPAGPLALVDFAMHHARASAHGLDLSCCQYFRMAHRIAVAELPLHHHRDDLHVAVGVHAKALAWGDGVVVDHPQGAKPHPLRIVVASKGKRVPAIQPIALGVEALGGWAKEQWHQARGGGRSCSRSISSSMLLSLAGAWPLLTSWRPTTWAPR